MLQAKNVTKIYEEDGNEFRALNDVSVDISGNDCVAIVGKSGSGKSTLMHMLACLDTPSTGVIEYNGENVSDFDASRLNRFRNETYGFVFQQFFLNGRDTVLENVVLPLKIRGVDSKTRRTRGLEMLEAVGIGSKASKPAKQLSGGEKQRVCIARALISEPRIVFADEPTGNLDSATSSLIEDLLFKLNSERGIALVVVTHDEELASKCGRIVELKDGSVVSERAGAQK